jgi:hypothetical protein
MKVYTFVGLLFFLGMTQAFAQFENTNKKSDLPGFPVAKSPFETGNSNNNIIKPKDTVTLIQPEKKKFSMANTQQWHSDVDKYTRKMNNEIRAKENSYKGSSGNKMLGEIKTKSKYVKIVYRDHEYPDGDIVRVLHNNRTSMDNLWLTSEFRDFNIALITGFNMIDFQALNQGDSGPNTAEFHVIDDKGNLIFSNKWLLSTGAKASVMIVREADDSTDGND